MTIRIQKTGESAGGEPRPYGLPGPLPTGERILWQGSPDWKSLAWRAFHLREIAVYFAILAAWRAASALAETGSAADAAARAAIVLPFLAAVAGLVVLLAWLTARNAVYTLTEKRVVLSTGVALTATLNLPLAEIESANLKTYGDGVGDISLGLGEKNRMAFLTLWPHARPWRLKNPEPTLRAIRQPERVATLLSEALAPGGAARVAQAAEAPAKSGPRAEPALAS